MYIYQRVNYYLDHSNERKESRHQSKKRKMKYRLAGRDLFASDVAGFTHCKEQVREKSLPWTRGYN